jgi:hypothetical protein
MPVVTCFEPGRPAGKRRVTVDEPEEIASG